jgi:hypothetical protein
VNGPKLLLNGAASQAFGMASMSLRQMPSNTALFRQMPVMSTSAGGLLTISRMNWIERHGPSVCSPDRRGFDGAAIEVMAKRIPRWTVSARIRFFRCVVAF